MSLSSPNRSPATLTKNRVKAAPGSGICVTCLPLKSYGEKIAREERNARAYRYGDLNHVLEFCCGTPQNCPFFREVVAEQAKVAKRLR